MITSFDTIHERDGHTHRQTPHDGIGRALMHSIARQKMFADDVKVYLEIVNVSDTVMF